MPELKDPDWITVAKEELGEAEVFGSTHNDRILEYHKATTLKAKEDEVPWCSAFVTWVLETSHYLSTKSAWARSYIGYGILLEKPLYGCIVILSRGTESGHVGFYMGEDEKNIRVLGGNQSNKVCVANYPKERVLAYRWPKKAT